MLFIKSLTNSLQLYYGTFPCQVDTYKDVDQFFEAYGEGEFLEPVVDPGTILVINVGEMHELTSADLDRIAFTDQQEAKRLVEMYQDNVGNLIEEY